MRIAIALVLVACGGDETDTAFAPTPGTTAPGTTTTIGNPTHDADIQPIWEEACGTSCHIDDNDGDLQLGTDAYDAIVNVPSVDVPTMNLITPGNLDESYLWHKLEGTHLSVGGEGLAMPRGSVNFGKKKHERIEKWILDGAPR